MHSKNNISKKMKMIPSIFKNKQANQPWQWPSPCNHPKTLSFRGHEDLSRTIVGPHESPTSTHSSTSEEVPLEAVMSGVRLSERLFFEPEETSSIVKDSKNGEQRRPSWPFKDSVAMALESEDPYVDFKRSMEEMVESQGLFKDWDCLEELLLWYLRMNGKINHGFIVGAFVDLLVGFAAVDSKKTMMMQTSASDSTSTMYSSASSSFSSPSSPLSPHHQL